MEVDREGGLRAALSILIGFCFVALTNAVAIAVTVPRSGGIGLRAAHHAFDAAQTVGVGALLAVVLGGWVAFARAPLWLSLTAYSTLSTAVLGLVLGQNLERQATVAFEGRGFGAIFVAYVALTGLGIPAAHVIGALLSRYRYLRLIPVLGSIGGVVFNHLVLRDDYPDVHGAVGWAAATLMGTAVGPALIDSFRRRASRRARASFAAALFAVGCAGLLIPPPNRVRIELFRQPGAMGAWLLASTVWSLPKLSARARPPSQAPRPTERVDRASLPPIPASYPPLASGPPVVVFLTIDAVRADIVDDARYEAGMPYIAQMKRRGAFFTRAISPGSQTAVSLTSVFSGRYFSELFWGMHGRGSARFAYAARDKSPRFPELLASRSVRSICSLSINFLASEFGVLRGCTDEIMVAEGRKHAPGEPVIAPLIERLSTLDPAQPALFYAHLTEPHAPYDRGAATGTDRERYISEIGVADALVARVGRALGSRFPGRGFLILSSDHGEAFGEHGTYNHTKTLYEELLRVPLLVVGPGVRPRRIGERVSLIDLGPTILDIFGAPTPTSYEGQSLVPLLAGEDRRLDRPILAEGRLRRAFYWGDLKVIEDDRRKVVEAYDLERDPRELVELFSTERARIEPALAAMRAFFDENRARAPGYRAPYKP